MLALARPVALLLAGARSTAACRSQAAAFVNHLHSGSGPSGLDEEAAAVYELAAAFGAEQLAPRSAEWDRGQQPFPVDVVRHAARLGARTYFTAGNFKQCCCGALKFLTRQSHASCTAAITTGFAGLFVPQEHGGSASSRSRTLGALIFEGLARGDVPVTAYLTIHNMVGYAISRFGTQQQRDELLPGLVTAEWLAAYCLTEPGSGSDAGSLTTSAERVHGGWRLQGSKAFISGGGLADLYLVMARARGQSESEPSGVTAFLLKAGTPGLSFGPPERKLGWRCQPTASVHLDGVVVPDKDVLGDVGGGMRIALHALDGGRVNIAACSLGGAGAALDYAWRYAAQRQQFGRAIGDFQASQFKLADMATGVAAQSSWGHPQHGTGHLAHDTYTIRCTRAS